MLSFSQEEKGRVRSRTSLQKNEVLLCIGTPWCRGRGVSHALQQADKMDERQHLSEQRDKHNHTSLTSAQIMHHVMLAFQLGAQEGLSSEDVLSIIADARSCEWEWFIFILCKTIAVLYLITFCPAKITRETQAQLILVSQCHECFSFAQSRHNRSSCPCKQEDGISS